jgi:hypothetical protein
VTALLAGLLTRLQCLILGHRYIDDTDPLACRDCPGRTIFRSPEETP